MRVNGHDVENGVCKLCDAGDPTSVVSLREPCTALLKEICVECGRSVAQGTGLYVNRVPVNDDEDMGRPYPHGKFLCVACAQQGGNNERVNSASS